MYDYTIWFVYCFLDKQTASFQSIKKNYSIKSEMPQRKTLDPLLCTTRSFHEIFWTGTYRKIIIFAEETVIQNKQTASGLSYIQLPDHMYILQNWKNKLTIKINTSKLSCPIRFKYFKYSDG